eukprot:2067645-Rhodomonas_salina.1
MEGGMAVGACNTPAESLSLPPQPLALPLPLEPTEYTQHVSDSLEGGGDRDQWSGGRYESGESNGGQRVGREIESTK